MVYLQSYFVCKKVGGFVVPTLTKPPAFVIEIISLGSRYTGTTNLKLEFILKHMMKYTRTLFLSTRKGGVG